MAKIIRELEFEDTKALKEFLKHEFNTTLLIDREILSYDDQELMDILVNLKIYPHGDKVRLIISKLVTLKAFLLSKEQGMDITELVYKIDKIMNMSRGGLEVNCGGIVDDENLREFLQSADISVKKNNKSITLNDKKREVSLRCNDEIYDFNTIELTKEF